MYLREEINKLFIIYPKSFDKVALEKLELKENEIDYKNLSYKFYFSEEDKAVSHKIDFLRRYGILYGLLEDLVTRKINIDNANVDQLNFIINLILWLPQGFGKSILRNFLIFYFCSKIIMTGVGPMSLAFYVLETFFGSLVTLW